MLGPIAASGASESLGRVAASSTGTTLPYAGTVNTKNATWTQIVASTTRNAQGFIVGLIKPTVAASDFCVDIAIGASGSERIIAADLLLSNGTGTSGCGTHLFIPLAIPAGTRISARQATTTASATCGIVITLLADLMGGVEPYAASKTYGARLTGGVTLDCGGVTANTKSAYVAVGTVTDPVEAFIPQFGNVARSIRTTSGSMLIDFQFSYGGGSAIVLPDVSIDWDSSVDRIGQQFWPPVVCQLPSGGTISVRGQASLITADSRVVDISVVTFG